MKKVKEMTARQRKFLTTAELREYDDNVKWLKMTPKEREAYAIANPVKEPAEVKKPPAVKEPAAVKKPPAVKKPAETKKPIY